MHVQVALWEFLLQLEANGRSPHTVAQYRRHVRALIAWLPPPGGETEVADLTPGMVAGFFTSDAAKVSCRGGQKKATSLNAMRTSIRCFAAHLHDAGLVQANPARLLRRARCAPPPPKALRPDEQRRLLRVLAEADGPEAERDRMLVELLLGTGIRIGSAVALDVEDLDLEHGEITLRSTKNNRPATVFVPEALSRALKGYLNGRSSGHLFQGVKGRISLRHAQRRVKGWMRAAGFSGKCPHCLRHSFATTLLEQTGNLRLVQAALHHASIVSTTVYAQLDKAQLRAILAP